MTKRTTREDSGQEADGLDREALEYKRAAEALRGGDARFQALVESASEVIVLTAADGTLLYVSPSAERVSGYTPEELTGMSFFDVIHPDDQPAAADNLGRILSEPGASGSIPLRFRHKDGSWSWLEGVGRNLLHDPRIQAIVCVYRDIGERKRAEEEQEKRRSQLEALVEERTAALKADIAERERVEKALRENEAKLADALRMGKMGSWEFDLESQEATWSAPLFELLDRDSSLGPPDFAEELTTYYPNDSERVMENCLRAIETGESFSMDYHVKLPSGRSAYHHSTFHPIRDQSGRVSKLMGTVQDISERKRMEEDLVKAQKLESVGILAGGIAHDFNNILSAIWGNIDLAKMDAEPGGRVFKSLEHAVRACHRATDLTAQLLTFSKGGIPVKKPTSISRLLRDTAAFSLSGSNVKCEFELPDGLWPAEVDEGQINQVLSNLILNAVHAMPEGGTIQIRANNTHVGIRGEAPLKPGKYVKLSIQDRGTGIKAEHLQKIFDPYFTTKQKGSGLGLAVVHSIIDKHAGHVRVESELGTGTTFHVYLPASETEFLEAESSREDIVTGEGRVLVMDDDEMIIDTVGRMLTRLGYDAEFARDGSQAVELYREALESGNPFAAVILDLTIPGGMGGKEAARQLREMDSGIKAIVSSGYSKDPVMADFEEYGFVGVIPKPYEIEPLSRVLSRVIDTSR